MGYLLVSALALKQLGNRISLSVYIDLHLYGVGGLKQIELFEYSATTVSHYII